VLDYDREAAHYDETRGGTARARAAAACVSTLAPTRGVLADIAGGTGIVAAELAAAGFDVIVVDQSIAMLGHASRRLAGRVVAGDSTMLPLAASSVDVAMTMWLLHLLPSADAVTSTVAEAARVVRAGGHYITTVDKNQAPQGRQLDARATVERVAAAVGLRLSGESTYRGVGQQAADGREPVYTVLCFAR
jgi:ubiquinone/menaquinone biosynthesis C-methylase UbiE